MVGLNQFGFIVNISLLNSAKQVAFLTVIFYFSCLALDKTYTFFSLIEDAFDDGEFQS